MTFSRKSCVGAILVGTLCAMASQAPAQEARNGATFGDWQLICEATGVNRTVCALRQTLSFSENGAFVAEVALRRVPSADDTRTVIVLSTPTGIFLPAAPGMAVDGSDETLPLEWRSCDANICTASRVLSDNEVAALRGGAELRMGYRPVNQSDPVLFSISLTGVTAGLAALDS